ncbi:tetratricopeptide repeat protein, partial [Leptolyngbya sp. FACHB-36]|uniref:tetratricopeptide repeat protein n=1 Tax=Leptolyngbya sp. FACHB-36 TaxID=2692808 RepID=UPI0016809BCC
MLSPLKPFKLIRRVKLFFLSFITCFLCLLLSEPLRIWGQIVPEIAQAVSPSDRDLSEKRVLVSEVVVQGVTGKLQDIVYQAAATKPGRVTTRSQLQTDINAIFKTGWFSNVKAVPEDTLKGVRVTFEVQLNPVLRRMNIVPIPESKSVLPTAVVNDIFRSQYGTVLNLQTLQAGIRKLNQWYQNNGYVLAKVVGQPRISMDGTVTLQIAEGIIESLRVQFVNSQNKLVSANGQPLVGKTPASVILQAIESKPGMVFNQVQIQKGLKQILGLSSVKDATVAWEIPKDSRNVILIVKVQETVSASAEAENTDRIIQAEAALQRARAQKDPFAEAIAQRTLFDLQMATGKQSDVDRYQIALKRAQASRDRAGEAEALKGLAYFYNKDAKFRTNDSSTENNQPSFDKDKKKQAIATYQAALKIYQELNNDTQAAIILRNIGFMLEELDDYPAAIVTYRKAVPLFQKLKQPFWQALTLNNLAASYREIGETDQSLALQQQASTLWQYLREHPDQLESSSLLSRVYQPGDRPSETGISWTRSSKSGSQADIKFYLGTSDLRNGGLIDVRFAEGMTLLNLGGIYQTVGDYQQALYTFKLALSLLQIPPSTLYAQLQNVSTVSQKNVELFTDMVDVIGDFLMHTLYADMGWQQQAQDHRDRALSKGRILIEKTLQEIATVNKTPELNSLLPAVGSLLISWGA